LEVFDREKKIGFAMSRLPAQIQWEEKTNGYVAKYLSASEVLPERIPAAEEHRLLFCPAAVRHSLHVPRFSGPLGTELRSMDCCGDDYEQKDDNAYPYQVLEGIADFRVGQGIELQWKMQQGSPFGWWYGTLGQLDRDANGVTATARIFFRHFPANSNWHWLDIRFGDGKTRPCTMGGWSGGVRPTSDDEQKHWMRFFPPTPVIF